MEVSREQRVTPARQPAAPGPAPTNELPLQRASGSDAAVALASP
jgi:hypothetical protein